MANKDAAKVAADQLKRGGLRTIPLAELKEYPQNVRIHTKRNLDVLKKSLAQFGQTKNIVVQKSTMYILAGNGTYQAAKALGWDSLDCRVIDIDDAMAKVLMVTDNRSSDLSQMDEEGLLQMLQEFAESDLLDLAGYSDQDLDSMLKYQDGTLFKEEKQKQERKKEKEKEVPVSADDQVSFSLMGYPFTLADPQMIRELKGLVDEFSKQSLEVRTEAVFAMYRAVASVLDEAVRLGVKPVGDPEIETDRG